MAIPDPLRLLAESYGVQTSYEDDRGRPREAAADSLVAVLRVLGAPLERLEESADALRARRQALWQRMLEPVLIAWDGLGGEALLRLPAQANGRTLSCQLHFES